MQAYKKQIVTRPQDVVVLMKIISYNRRGLLWNLVSLARELLISQSEISESLSRSTYTNLISYDKKDVQRNALLEFAIHGIKYAYPAKPGYIARGIATAHSAPPLVSYFRTDENYVWEYSEGDLLGQVIEPLYSSVPKAIGFDNELYELLALTDAIRVGKSRERNMAADELKKRILN